MELSPFPSPDRLATERGLVAELNLRHFRELKLGSLRWAAAVSFPIWLQTQTQAVPAFGVWLALLAEGCCLALAGSYEALEYRWARRAGQLAPAPPAVATQTIWSDWDELRSALWLALVLASLVPWAYLGLGRPMPAALTSALTAIAATLFLLVVAAETASQWHSARRRLG